MALTLLADLVLRSAPQPGLIVAVLGLLALLARPLRGIGRALEAREAARVARERMLEFLNDPARRPRPARPRDTQQPSAAPSLRFAQVSVAGRLEPFSGDVPFGRRVAVCGPVGSGKSTLLALAAGLLDPDGGAVLLDGRRLHRIDASTLQRCVGFVAAEPVLPRGSIRRGLRQRRPDAGDDALLAACALAGWRDADAAALDIRVRDDGANIHAQRRRELALAAALVGDPPLLLIDEPERALPGDPVRCLARLLHGRRGSVLFSTHDPRLAALADEVWTLPAAAKPAPAAAGGEGPMSAGADLRLVRAK
jgi:ABC-type bacteriocin/lantibiotic exporter with double-glycine peptidase domain